MRSGLLPVLLFFLVACGGGAPMSPNTPASTAASPAGASSSGAPEVTPPTFIRKQIEFQLFGEAFGAPVGNAETTEKLAMGGRLRYFHIVCTIDPAARKRSCIDVALKRSPMETKFGAESFDGWTDKILNKCFKPAVQPMPRSAMEALNRGGAITRAAFGDGDVPVLYVAYIEKSAGQEKWSWEVWAPRGKWEPGDSHHAENILALAGMPRGNGKVPLFFPADESGTLDSRFAAVDPEAFGEYHPGFERVRRTRDALAAIKLAATERDARIAVMLDQASLLAVLGDAGLAAAVADLKQALAAGPPKSEALAAGVKEGLALFDRMASAPFSVTNPCE